MKPVEEIPPKLTHGYWNLKEITLCGANVDYDHPIVGSTRHPHLVTCSICLARGPRLFATRDGGYAIEKRRPKEDLYLVWVHPPKDHPDWTDKCVFHAWEVVQVGGPITKAPPRYFEQR